MKKLLIAILLLFLASPAIAMMGSARGEYASLELTTTTFTFTTEANMDSPLISAVILLAGDNDTENDAIDLQNGHVVGQTIFLVAESGIDTDDTCTIAMTDTTCTNCPAVVFDKIGENALLVWTGTSWAVISVNSAL